MAQGRENRSRRFLWELAAITVVALGLRLVVCAELQDLPSVRTPWIGTDMATYRRLAMDLLAGKLPDAFYYQPFYYAVFLPAVYASLGSGAWSIMLVQAVLGAATVWMTGLVAARLFGRRAGLIAGALLAVARYPVFYTPFLLIATLQSFWMALLLFTGIRAHQTGRVWRWAVAGLVAGLAVLTRGNALLLVPGILALAVWRQRRRPGQALTVCVLILVLVYAPQLPFALRNARHYGRWTGPSTAQDAVLALGNTPEAAPGGLVYTDTYKDWMSEASKPRAERTPVSRQILGWIRTEPLAFLELKFRMLLLFWHQQEIPNNIAMQNEGRHSTLLRLPGLPGFGLIGSLAAWGMLLSWRIRAPQRLFLHFTVVVYCLGTVLFYILARFRVPLMPVLCVFAGAAVAEGLRLLPRRGGVDSGRGRRHFALVAFFLSLFLVLQGYPFYQMFLEKHVLRLVRRHGVVSLTTRALRLYDHGPAVCGGWRLQSVPQGGLKLRKTLSIPAWLAQTGPYDRATVRLPIMGDPGSRARVLIGVRGGHPESRLVTLKGGQGPDWLESEIPGLGPPADPVVLDIEILPEVGTLYLPVDTYRDYGRTAVQLADRVWAQLEAEAALELVWPRR